MNTSIEFLNLWGDHWVSFAQRMLLQSSVLIVALLLLDLFMRRQARAVVRYGVLLLILVKLVLPPSFVLPTALGYWVGSRPEPNPRSQTSAATILQIDASTDNQPGLYQKLTGKPAAQSLGRNALLFLIWVFGGVGLLGYLIYRSHFVKRKLAEAHDAKGDLLEFLGVCSQEMRLKMRVGLRLSNETLSPAVCGLVRPVILMAAELPDRLSVPQLRSVFLHELAHIKRRDLWVNCAQTVLQIFYWWHPLLWLANGRIRRVREEAVDETVMAALGHDAESYPSALIEVAKSIIPKTVCGPGFLGIIESQCAFSKRIQRLLSRPIPESAQLSAGNFAALLLLAIVALPMAQAEGEKRNQPASAIAEDVQPGSRLDRSPPGQKDLVTVDVMFYALPALEISNLKLSKPHHTDEHGVSSWTFESKDLKALLRQISQQSGATLLSAPRITTSAGRQAVLQVVEDSEPRDVFSVGVTPSREAEVIHLNLKVHAGQLSYMGKYAALSRFLQSEAEALELKVEEADRKLQLESYHQSNGSSSPDEAHKIAVEVLVQARVGLLKAEAEADRIQRNAAELDQVEDVRAKQKKVLEITDDATLKTSLANLSRHEAELSALLTRYKERWPAVKEARADIASLQSSIQDQTERLVVTMKRKADLDRGTAEGLRSQVQKQEQQLSNLNRKRIEYDNLSRDLQSKRELLNKVNDKRQEIEIAMKNRPVLENPKIGEASFVSTHFYLQTDVALQEGSGAVFQIPNAHTRDGKMYLLVAIATLNQPSSESARPANSMKR